MVCMKHDKAEGQEVNLIGSVPKFLVTVLERLLLDTSFFVLIVDVLLLPILICSSAFSVDNGDTNGSIFEFEPDLGVLGVDPLIGSPAANFAPSGSIKLDIFLLSLLNVNPDDDCFLWRMLGYFGGETENTFPRRLDGLEAELLERDESLAGDLEGDLEGERSR
ncbi:hypothetical protein WICPIJ_003407 [Wickerhamomyces pijperi]|uniref:Uncharacterized protein n=1 Tax=Wickerhamomyces pijperi TaxID=599730 RepID=A0A9P8Q759_WICPI|nr:hypothetical protein WICPIJ_003407 [Wickerhamomyces pijperi]